jgi:arylsulfatase A-like enzyme
VLSVNLVALLSSIPRLERRSAGVLVALAVCAATLFGAFRGAMSIIENGYLPLGMPRLAAVTLHEHLRWVISVFALPVALVGLLLAIPFPGRNGAPRRVSGVLLRRARPIALGAVTVLVSVLGLGVAIAVDRRIDDGPQRPHVIWLVIDALRADHLGCYGYARDTSPFIDRWSREAILFRRAYAQESYTIASVASFFTSTYPWTNGVLYDSPEIDALDSHFVTLAEVLREHNYRTAAFVFNPHLKARFNFAQGFDLYDDRKQFLRRFQPDPERFETARRIFKKTERLLAEHDGAPLFLYAHFRDVHSPYVPLAPYDEMFPPRDASEQEKRMALYDGEIRYTDGYLNRLLGLLASHGIDASNSILILSSDHGEEFRDRHPGDPGGWFHARTLYEELIRVPLLVSLPGRRFAGKVVDEPVGLIDLVPTILDVLGIDGGSFGQFEGESLLPLVRGETSPDRVVWSGGNHGRVALLSDGWKYYRYHRPTKLGLAPALIRPPQPITEGFAEEIYHLSSDPHEAVDLRATRADRMAILREQATSQPLLAAREPLRSMAIDPETERELRALGYLE